MDVPFRSPPSRSLVSTFFQPCFFALRLTTSSIPAEESIARTGTSGKDFLTSAVTVPRPHPSSRTVEEGVLSGLPKRDQRVSILAIYQVMKYFFLELRK